MRTMLRTVDLGVRVHQRILVLMWMVVLDIVTGKVAVDSGSCTSRNWFNLESKTMNDNAAHHNG